MAPTKAVLKLQRLDERAQRFIDRQTASARAWLLLDYDILFLICKQLDTRTLKSLTHFLGPWRSEAQKRLLHTIDYHSHVCKHISNEFLSDGEAAKEQFKRRRWYWTQDMAYDETRFKCCTLQSTVTGRDACRATPVRDMQALCSLLDSNEPLRSWIQCAYIRREYEIEHEVDNLVQSLQRMGRLRRLHLTGRLPRRTNWLKTTSLLVTSIHVDYSIPSVRQSISFLELKRIFANPAVQEVQLSHFPFNSDIMPRYIEGKSISQVKSLVFTDGAPRRGALRTIINWLSELKSLRVMFDMVDDLEENSDCVREMVQELMVHRTSLEQIQLGTHDQCYDWLTLPQTLLDFTNLKQADVLFENFVPVIRDYNCSKEEATSFFSAVGSFAKWIPSSIEELTIRLDSKFQWRTLYWPRYPPSARSVQVEHHFAESFLHWFGELVGQRAQKFPNLRKVKLIRSFEGNPIDGIHLMESRWQELNEYWSGHGIKLDIVARDKMEKWERVDAGEPSEFADGWTRLWPGLNGPSKSDEKR